MKKGVLAVNPASLRSLLILIFCNLKYYNTGRTIMSFWFTQELAGIICVILIFYWSTRYVKVEKVVHGTLTFIHGSLKSETNSSWTALQEGIVGWRYLKVTDISVYCQYPFAELQLWDSCSIMKFLINMGIIWYLIMHCVCFRSMHMRNLICIRKKLTRDEPAF